MEADDITLPPAQNSSKNIINILNDDCLKAIFLKLEHLYDFFRAAEVCTRFQNNAKMCLPFRTIRFGDRMPQRERDEVSFDDADKFLSIFGQRIKLIDCHLLNMNRLDHDDFLNAIAKYCGETLTELKITEGKFSYLRTPFQVLTKLRLVNCSFPNFDPAIIFPELQSLLVCAFYRYPIELNFTIDIDWIGNRFPKLEHANFRGENFNNYSKFTEFQNHNPQLKSLRTALNCKGLISIWEGIGDRMPNIESVSIWCMIPLLAGMIDIGTLPRLKNFNLFRCRCSDADARIVNSIISNFMIYKQPIETLRISFVDNELGRILQNFKTLKTLYIQESSDDITFEFVNHLPTLQYLRIYHPNLSTAEEILQNANNLAELKIFIGPLSNANFNLQVYKSIIALATGRVKITIFYDFLCRSGKVNNEEKQILFQVSINKSEWVRFERYSYYGFQVYPYITFD